MSLLLWSAVKMSVPVGHDEWNRNMIKIQKRSEYSKLLYIAILSSNDYICHLQKWFWLPAFYNTTFTCFLPTISTIFHIPITFVRKPATNRLCYVMLCLFYLSSIFSFFQRIKTNFKHVRDTIIHFYRNHTAHDMTARRHGKCALIWTMDIADDCHGVLFVSKCPHPLIIAI